MIIHTHYPNSKSEYINKLKRELDKELNIDSDIGEVLHVCVNDGGVVVGFVGTSVGVSLDNKTIGIITALYVTPAYRGLGISNQLLMSAAMVFQEFGVSRIQLEADTGSVAELAYTTRGFSPIHVTMEANVDDLLRTCKERE